MKSLCTLSRSEMQALYHTLLTEYNIAKARGLSLDLSRGKPHPSQLDLSMDMLAMKPEDIIITRRGTDVRNYGELAGVDEAKEMFAELLGVKMSNIIMGGQSSLALMYDAIAKALLLGVYGGSKPWGKQEKLRFLCPTPGYDRHFAICEEFGIEMISVPMSPTGPDMAMVKEYVENDPAVKGIWCVPKYSNPQGYTYSAETVDAFAALKPAADDFRIFWDNAYLVHGHGAADDKLVNIFDACKKYGSEDMVYEFFSTSKITFSGAGLAVFAASENNVKHLLRQMGIQTIGYDKINQLRHVRYFGSVQGIYDHMKKHAALLYPKFSEVQAMLEEGLGETGIGCWTHPNGGYFIAYDGLPGTAKRCVALCAEAGLKLTPAGAAFPYGKDPEDKNIRIAPTFATPEQLRVSIPLFCLCQKLAALEVLMKKAE